MENSYSDRKIAEEVYHDAVYRKGVIQKGHLSAADSSYYKFFYKLIGDVKGSRILEVGCGEGWLAIKLAKHGAEVYGIDISGELINAAIAESAKQGCSKNINFVRIAVEDLSFDDVFFDLVIGSAILHHTDIKLAITNIVTLLGPKGRAIFIEPLNENPMLKAWRKLTPFRRSPTERALLRNDLNFIRSMFPYSQFHYFSFTSTISTGLLMFFPKSSVLKVVNNFLEKLDSFISLKLPFLGPYFAVVVLDLKKAGS